MFRVDRNDKMFLAARIVMSWRRWEGEEKGREKVVARKFCRLAVVSLGEKPHINPLLLVMFYGSKCLFR